MCEMLRFVVFCFLPHLSLMLNLCDMAEPIFELYLAQIGICVIVTPFSTRYLIFVKMLQLKELLL